MNGLELYREIKKIDNKVKVCFLTASEFGYGAFIDVFSNLKENRLIQKPIGNEELIKRINEITSSNMLGLIGQAEMEKRIQEIAKKITQDKDSLEIDTQQPIELDQKELKKYVDIVIREVKNKDKNN